MRKLKLQVQISIDGFIAGPNSEMDWMTWNWDDKLKDYVNKLTEPVDCIIMGSNLAPGFIPHWEKLTVNPSDEQYPFAMKMTNTKKVVFSKTLNNTDANVASWKNTVLAKRDLTEEITALKSVPGGDIIVYGGAKFVSSLIKEHLIDEYHLFINPVAIGKGLSIFESLDDKQQLKLIKTAPFECGIVVLNYIKHQ
jgi:dihydrofolate reductase